MTHYRIACFSMNYPPRSNAESYVTARWVNALRDQGHVVDVFAWSEPSAVLVENVRIMGIIHDIAVNMVDARKHRTLDFSQIGPLTRYIMLALEMFRQKHRVEPYDFIVSRYEPMASAIAAYWAHLDTAIPWIGSYNDPIPRRMPRRRGIISLWDMHKRRFQTKWSSQLLVDPDWLVFPSVRLREWVLGHGANKSNDLEKQALRQRSSVIPHIGGPFGFQKYDLDTRERPNNTVYTVRHIGYLSTLRDPSTLFGALETWENSPGLPSIRVEFIGNSSAQREAIERFLITPRTRVELQVLPGVDQDEAFRLIQTADVCILIEEPAEESVFLPTKFCDYAAARRPILAITCDAATVTDYLRQYGGGEVANHGAPDSVFSLLRDMLQRGSLESTDLALQFDPRSVALAWADVFQKARERAK